MLSPNFGFGSKTWPNHTPRLNTRTAAYSNAASPSPKPHTGGDRTSEHILIVIVKADNENISPINKVIDWKRKGSHMIKERLKKVGETVETKMHGLTVVISDNN